MLADLGWVDLDHLIRVPSVQSILCTWPNFQVRRKDPGHAHQVHHRLGGQEALRRADRRDRGEGGALAHRRQRRGGARRRQTARLPCPGMLDIFCCSDRLCSVPLQMRKATANRNSR